MEKISLEIGRRKTVLFPFLLGRNENYRKFLLNLGELSTHAQDKPLQVFSTSIMDPLLALQRTFFVAY